MGTGGVEGHAVRIEKSGQGAWELRTGEVETIRGTFEPDAEELRKITAWADAAWLLCERTALPTRKATPPPRWMWCVVVRRGNEARWLADRDDAPEELRPWLDWLARRVGGLAGSVK